MSKVRVSITQADIDVGLPGVSWSCAVVQALHRSFPNSAVQVTSIVNADGSVGHMVFVYELYGTIQPTNKLTHVFVLSGNGSRWVSAFDKRRTVKPATFELTSVEFEGRRAAA